MNKGWISVHRNIQDCWIWKCKPFSEGQAWIDLLLLANHRDNKMYVDGELSTVHRGQFVTSVLTLSNRWGWDRRKVTKFLNVLEADNMIVRNSTTHGTTITIENYSVYQDASTTECTTDVQPNVQPHVQPMHTNNNVNNVNNVNNENKKKYSPVIKEVIEYLNQVSGKNYKPDTTKSVTCIKARINEGFTLEDFKTVIDIKCGQWMNNESMKAYIRPETLFGNKFEGYLNEKGGVDDEPSGTSYVEFTEEQYRAAKEAGYGLSGVQW